MTFFFFCPAPFVFDCQFFVNLSLTPFFLSFINLAVTSWSLLSVAFYLWLKIFQNTSLSIIPLSLHSTNVFLWELKIPQPNFPVQIPRHELFTVLWGKLNYEAGKREMSYWKLTFKRHAHKFWTRYLDASLVNIFSLCRPHWHQEGEKGRITHISLQIFILFFWLIISSELL